MEKMILSLYLVAVTASFVAATTTSATDTTSSTSSTTQTPTTASTTTEKMIDNSIVITKLWNGTELQDDSDQVVLRFTNTDENELQVRMEAISGTIQLNSISLQIEFEAAFYNSPIPSQPMIETCPERPFNGLYNYEVVEVFFLNDNDQVTLRWMILNIPQLEQLRDTDGPR